LSCVNLKRWDPKTDSWSYVASMTSKRQSPQAAELGGKLYVIGGQNEGDFNPTMECYDPMTNCWSFKASLISKRPGFGVNIFVSF